MAAKEKQAAAGGDEAAAKPKKKLPMTAIIIAGITIVQAAGFFMAFKMFAGGAPEPTYGAEHGEGEHHAEGDDPHAQPAVQMTAEIPLLEKLRVPNNKSGRMYMYDLDIVIVTSAEQKAEVEKLKTERAAEISDRIAQIVRAADPRVLEEDDLRTLRTQMQAAISTIAGNPEIVQRVLIPRCMPIRAE